jgi:hypothetical protein
MLNPAAAHTLMATVALDALFTHATDRVACGGAAPAGTHGLGQRLHGDTTTSCVAHAGSVEDSAASLVSDTAALHSRLLYLDSGSESHRDDDAAKRRPVRVRQKVD